MDDGAAGAPQRAAMLLRGFAGFQGLFVVGCRTAKSQNADIKQSFRRTKGGAHDEHPSMLFRTFAVYITLCRMSSAASEIGASSATIRELYARIDETFAKRDLSPAHREAWSRACAEFHARYGALSYPGGDSRWQALMALDSSEIETGIAFLEADPFFFRSGYMKEAIWNRLKAAQLHPKQLRRLEAAGLRQLHRQIRRDFWYMVRFARMRGSPEFWETVHAASTQDRGTAGLKAWWMILARANYPVQHWIGSQLLRARYEKHYAPNLAFGWHAA